MSRGATDMSRRGCVKPPAAPSPSQLLASTSLGCGVKIMRPRSPLRRSAEPQRRRATASANAPDGPCRSVRKHRPTSWIVHRIVCNDIRWRASGQILPTYFVTGSSPHPMFCESISVSLIAGNVKEAMCALAAAQRVKRACNASELSIRGCATSPVISSPSVSYRRVRQRLSMRTAMMRTSTNRDNVNSALSPLP